MNPPVCDHCAMPVYERVQPDASGNVLHLSCADAVAEPVEVEDDGLAIYAEPGAAP